MQGNPQPGWQHRAARSYGHDRPGQVYGGQGGYGRSGGRPEWERPRPRDVPTRNARTPRPRRGDPRERERRPAAGRGRPRSRTPMWARLTLTAGAVLMLLSGTALAGYEVISNRYAGNVQQENLLGGAAADPGQELDGPINMLLLGVDARTPDTEDDVRSDTIIVLHVPSTHDQAYLISVPRDTLVTVPGYWDMKITEAFQEGYRDIGGWEGGTQLIAQTLSNTTGVSFNAAAIINFSGFQKVIDEMGGVEFCVDTPATSEHLVIANGERMAIGRAKREGYWDWEPIRYEVGCQHLEGWQALDYARQRKTLESDDGDYGRQRHQQQLLQAMVDGATSTDVRTNLGTLDRLVLAAGDAVVVDTNGVDLIDFLFTVRNVRPGDLISMRTNGGEFNSTQIDGKSYEQLTPESLDMFRAAADDTMSEFVIQHPDFINTD